MARQVPLPPPGFDELSAEDKVSYVQSLWDRIAANEDQVPVPDWHRAIVRERLREREAHPGELRDWEEVREELERELENREPEE